MVRWRQHLVRRGQAVIGGNRDKWTWCDWKAIALTFIVFSDTGIYVEGHSQKNLLYRLTHGCAIASCFVSLN